MFYCLLIFTIQFQQVKTDVIDINYKVQLLQEIVVSASRVSEKQLSAPVSISKLTNSQIQQSASPSFYDTIGNIKGVQIIVPSLGFSFAVCFLYYYSFCRKVYSLLCKQHVLL